MINNPTGKGSAQFIRRGIARDGMHQMYLNIIRRYKHKVEIQGYHIFDTYLYHIKVPSGNYNINKIIYDVFIEIDDSSVNRRLALPNRPARFWSNDPSFQFIYEYVFYHSDLIPHSLEKLVPDIAKTHEPRVRNPIESLGWEKFIYVASRLLIDSTALSSSFIQKRVRVVDEKQLDIVLDRVLSTEEIIPVYKAAQRAHALNQKSKLSKEQKEQERKDKEVVRKQENQYLKDKKDIQSKMGKLPKKAKLAKMSVMKKLGK
jgi:aconitase A